MTIENKSTYGELTQRLSKKVDITTQLIDIADSIKQAKIDAALLNNKEPNKPAEETLTTEASKPSTPTNG